jgi:hypothetical protein
MAFEMTGRNNRGAKGVGGAGSKILFNISGLPISRKDILRQNQIFYKNVKYFIQAIFFEEKVIYLLYE